MGGVFREATQTPANLDRKPSPERFVINIFKFVKTNNLIQRGVVDSITPDGKYKIQYEDTISYGDATSEVVSEREMQEVQDQSSIFQEEQGRLLGTSIFKKFRVKNVPTIFEGTVTGFDEELNTFKVLYKADNDCEDLEPRQMDLYSNPRKCNVGEPEQVSCGSGGTAETPASGQWLGSCIFRYVRDNDLIQRGVVESITTDGKYKIQYKDTTRCGDATSEIVPEHDSLGLLLAVG